MFLRFVVAQFDEHSGRELGVFHAVRYLHDEGKLYHWEEEHYDFVREWFDEHLKRPTRFTTSKPPFYRKLNKAISWFKDSAHEHLKHMQELVAILENHGVAVQVLETERVGYVAYEDEFQIVAEPFDETY